MRSEVSAAVSEICEYQAKLLARMGALDLPYLLEQLVLSHEQEFDACQYSPLLSSDYAKAMFLLTRRMPRHLATCPAPAGHIFTLSKDEIAPAVAPSDRNARPFIGARLASSGRLAAVATFS